MNSAQLSYSLSCLISSVGRALHRYRKGHGFKSHTEFFFFQVLFQLLVKRGSLILVTMGLPVQ